MIVIDHAVWRDASSCQLLRLIVHGDQPTLGLWVSCKGDKAYAYDLVDVSEG